MNEKDMNIVSTVYVHLTYQTLCNKKSRYLIYLQIKINASLLALALYWI